MRNQTRPYTTEYPRIYAIIFKQLLDKPVGNYSLSKGSLDDAHRKFELKENDNGDRSVTFTINEKPHNIDLRLDNRSVSNKLYLCCPYCHKQRQSLYAIITAYACRECIGLHYPSQSERPKDRLMRRIRKKRQCLWGSDYPDINNMFKNAHYFYKPKYMKWESFAEKRSAIFYLERKYWKVQAASMEKTYGKFMDRLN
jgi:hypothetical protein